MSKKKFKDTKVGKFLSGAGSSIIDSFGDVLPDKGVMGVVKNLIKKDPVLPAEDKEKAFNLTFTILCVLLLCYLPVFFYRIAYSRYVSQISTETKFLVDQSILLIALLNSSFNPVIYAVRIRQIRVACMELVCRTITAE